jgi:hypothetical protein
MSFHECVVAAANVLLGLLKLHYSNDRSHTIALINVLELWIKEFEQ